MPILVPPHRMSQRRSRFLVVWTAALASAAVLLLGACANDGSDSSGGESAAVDRLADPGDPAGSADATTPGGKDGAGGGSRVSTAGLEERHVERRASLALRSADVGVARDRLLATVDRVGGYVADEHSRSAADGRLVRTSLRLVVPTDGFDRAMDGLAEAGTVASREQTARDVTEEVVDVDSRVESAEASLRRIRLLLGRAEKLGDVIRLEAELGERQADLESLQARRESLSARTTTGTIEVSVKPPSDDPGGPGDAETGFLAGLGAGWSALRSALLGLSTALGAALPFAVAVGVPGGMLVWLLLRARRRREASRPPATP